jgi:hypothetical protein
MTQSSWALQLTADNQAAVGTMTDTSDHLYADQILNGFPHLSISVIWARGHAELRWNEKADWLANEGAEDYLHPVLEGASLSWLKERNRAQVDLHWQLDYIDDLGRKNAPLALCKSLPSKHPSEEIKAILEAPRSHSARAAQVLLGHAFVGEFYDRHVPSVSTACECGIEMQTIKHLLFACPVTDPHRKHLHDKTSGQIMSEHVIMQTFAGRKGLLAFLAKSRAFKRPPHVDGTFPAGGSPNRIT